MYTIFTFVFLLFFVVVVFSLADVVGVVTALPSGTGRYPVGHCCVLWLILRPYFAFCTAFSLVIRLLLRGIKFYKNYFFPKIQKQVLKTFLFFNIFLIYILIKAESLLSPSAGRLRILFQGTLFITGLLSLEEKYLEHVLKLKTVLKSINEFLLFY